MKMGAMSMKLIGTVEVVEKDEAAHTALLRVKSRESGGTGHANADVTFHALRRRRDDPHPRADHRQGRVDGGGRRRRRARRAHQGLHSEAVGAVTQLVMRAVRPGEVPMDGGTRGPGGPGPPRVHRPRAHDYVCAECGNLLAKAMDADYMTFKVRVKCGVCKTINVSPRTPTTRRRRRAGRAIRSQAHDGRIAHRRDGEVDERVAVGALAGTPPKPKPFAASARSIGRSGASSAHSRAYSSRSKPSGAAGG